jgi:hypothetical protein
VGTGDELCKRLNRLLMLLQVHIKRRGRFQTYAKTVRAWLEDNSGARPAGEEAAPIRAAPSCFGASDLSR